MFVYQGIQYNQTRGRGKPNKEKVSQVLQQDIQGLFNLTNTTA